MSLVFRLWKSAWQPTIGTEVFKSIVMLIIYKTCAFCCSQIDSKFSETYQFEWIVKWRKVKVTLLPGYIL